LILKIPIERKFGLFRNWRNILLFSRNITIRLNDFKSYDFSFSTSRALPLPLTPTSMDGPWPIRKRPAVILLSLHFNISRHKGVILSACNSIFFLLENMFQFTDVWKSMGCILFLWKRNKRNKTKIKSHICVARRACLKKRRSGIMVMVRAAPLKRSFEIFKNAARRRK